MTLNIENVRSREGLLYGIATLLPGAVIAGGYLRDLLTDREPTDMDIFVQYEPNEDQLRALDGYLGLERSEAFFETFRRSNEGDNGYEGSSEEDDERTQRMSVLFEAQKGEFSYDIIVVPDVGLYVEEFPDNISRVTFSSNGLRMYEDFEQGHTEKVIYYRISAEAARAVKLRQKYPDYRFTYKLREANGSEE
jgi:hypothetical protein